MIVKQHIKLDHIGWITNDVKAFESFWVDILGFEKIWESTLSKELAHTLFGVDYGALCRRYKKGDLVIEVHKFDTVNLNSDSHFVKYGINHIALHVENRNELIQTISDYSNKTGKVVPVKIYHNPSGWDNMFIKDFENNWIELRETFK
jgi:catechol 2,3-dioxygenase-like lactoylglutathione lyase family enzyme